MLPFCIDQGVGVIPWSPLARGRLTRPWRETTARTETDEVARGLYVDEDHEIVDAVRQVAEDRGVSAAQVALAWVASRPGVTAPIVGATQPHHLDDAVAALDLELTAEECARLEAPYRPHAVTGLG
jgi:aryl-alcohol dehydrogenase (NADP+)